MSQAGTFPSKANLPAGNIGKFVTDAPDDYSDLEGHNQAPVDRTPTHMSNQRIALGPYKLRTQKTFKQNTAKDLQNTSYHNIQEKSSSSQRQNPMGHPAAPPDSSQSLACQATTRGA